MQSRNAPEDGSRRPRARALHFTVRHALRNLAILVVLVLLGIPSAAALAGGAEDAVPPLALGALAGVLGRLLGTERVGVAVVASTAAFGAAAIGLASSPVATGLLFGAAGALVGLAARRGDAGAASAVPLVGAFVAASSATEGGDAGTQAALLMIGGAWALVALSVLVRRRLVPAPARTPGTRHAWIFAASLGLLAGVGNWLVAALDVPYGAWLNLTIFVVALPTYHGTVRKIVDRSLGTVVGGALALALGLALPPATWPFVALVAMTLMVDVMSSGYWRYTALLTVAMVLLHADSSETLVRADGYRLGLTLAASAAVLLVAVLVRAAWLSIARRQAETGGGGELSAEQAPSERTGQL